MAEITNLFTPTTYDFLKQNTFVFTIKDLPFVSYTCQSVDLPMIQFGVANAPSPLYDRGLPGEKLTYGDLGITFIVSEDMQNYLELLDWMEGLGYSQNYQKKINFLQKRARERIDNSSELNLQYSTGTLIITNAANIPIKGVTFNDMFPTMLGSINFNSVSGSIGYATCQVTFRFNAFEFHSV